MQKFATITVGLASLASFLQPCPAPPAVFGAIVAGALSGEAAAITGAALTGKFPGKRAVLEEADFNATEVKRDDIFSTLPQPGGQLCAEQLNGVTVNVTPLGQGSFQLDNVPSACMTLSNVLIESDDGTQGPVPTPMGSAALKYTGVSDEQINSLQATLDQYS